MPNFLENNGLKKVLQSIDKRLAHEATSVFKTHPDWDAANLSILEGWVSGETATDTINNRTINNYDVYLVTENNVQYYFDSGVWISFTPDLSNYFTKEQSDTRYPALGDFAEINLAADSIAIPSKLKSVQEIIEAVLATPVQGLIRSVQSSAVTVQFTVGSHTEAATLPYTGAIASAKVGGLVRIERVWNKTVQEKSVLYSLDTEKSRCIPVIQQSDWNEINPDSPAYIHNKPVIPQGVEIVNRLDSERTDASLAANMGRELAEQIEEGKSEPLSTEAINSLLTSAGFPAIT
jgi:hypothetical protein